MNELGQLITEMLATGELEELVIPEGAVICPLCLGDGEGIPVPAVTVGEPQDREYPPCPQCGGKGYVVVDDATNTEEEHRGGDAIREGDQAESEAATGAIRD